MDYQKQATAFLQSTGTKFTTNFLLFGSMDWDKDGQKRNIFECKLKNERGEMVVVFGQSVFSSCAKVSKIDIDAPVEIYRGISYRNMHYSFGWKINTTTAQIRKMIAEGVDLYELIDVPALEAAYQKYVDDYVAVAKKAAYNTRVWYFGKADLELKLENEIKPALRRGIDEKVKALREETDYGNVQKDTLEPPTAYDVLAALTKYDPYTFEDFCANYGYDTDSRSAERIYNACVKEWQDVCRLWTPKQIELLTEIQ